MALRYRGTEISTPEISLVLWGLLCVRSYVHIPDYQYVACLSWVDLLPKWQTQYSVSLCTATQPRSHVHVITGQRSPFCFFCFFAPSAMKRSCASSSAAGGAERPAHPSSDLENKRQKCAQLDKLQTIVVYISFPLKNYNTNAQQQSAMEVIRPATETGADVINLAFARTANVATCSVEQPALN